jgi:hypothetical protein
VTTYTSPPLYASATTVYRQPVSTTVYSQPVSTYSQPTVYSQPISQTSIYAQAPVFPAPIVPVSPLYRPTVLPNVYGSASFALPGSDPNTYTPSFPLPGSNPSTYGPAFGSTVALSSATPVVGLSYSGLAPSLTVRAG